MNDITFLYNLEEKKNTYRHIEHKTITELAEQLQNFKLSLASDFAEEETLLDLHSYINRILFNLCQSTRPYSDSLDQDTSDLLLNKFRQTKMGYPDVFNNFLKPLAKTMHALMENKDNALFDFICAHLNANPNNSKNFSIVTKRSLPYSERDLILVKVNPVLDVSFYTENGYRKTKRTFDEALFLGSSNFFGSYSSRVLKAFQTTFVAYDFFLNKNQVTSNFSQLPQKQVVNTIQKGIIFENTLVDKKILEIKEENAAQQVVERIIQEQKNMGKEEEHPHIMASIVFIEDDRFLFISRESNVRILSPHDKNDFVKQINFKDLEEDDYLIIRNDRDTKLIAEVADKELLKDKAVQYRKLQEHWKKRLRTHVGKLGPQRVSDILSQKYKMKTASSVSVRNWCTEESICPKELPLLLEALKYKKNEIGKIHQAMKKTQNAHRQAGRIITRSLMDELKEDVFERLNEQGYYTFNSKTFNGASFNIERVVSIDNRKYSIFYHDLMKPINATN
ncbi:hypothetical protein [Domibacillus indicus]|uniref:hypothetical protein n=1 Tax=Domibacillus indicus TaxID=1437523 RepID=UPI00069721E5|nr:hypothetical protein [Domibacillus indicus]